MNRASRCSSFRWGRAGARPSSCATRSFPDYPSLTRSGATLTRVSWASILLLQVALASPRAAARSSTLTAAAQASARPEECSSALPASAARGGLTIWDTARDPALDRYCDVLAAGFAQLQFSPERAIESADRAEIFSPGRAGPHVLRGRAQAAKKAWALVRDHFERARSIDP